MRRSAPAAALVAALAGLPGCGGTPAVDAISGARVATMAEQQLEATHAELATGTMTCPTLDFVVDASVRCLRVAELSGGRQIRVLGTVTVTSTRDGGRLHVKLDDTVSAFGVSGEHLADELRPRVRGEIGTPPDDVRCPWLPGRRGAVVRCSVGVRDVRLVTLVRVTGVDPASYRTRYRFSDPLFDRRVNPALPSLLRAIRRGGVGS